MTNKIASILDYPKPGLDPSIWEVSGEMNSTVRQRILDKLKGFLATQGISDMDSIIDKIYIIGSLTSYQYTSQSDLDIHVHLDLDGLIEYLGLSDAETAVEIADKSWRRQLNIDEAEMVPGTNHPMEFYFEMPGHTTSLPNDGIYHLEVERWEKDPRTVDVDFDIAEIYPEVIEFAEGVVKSFDINIGRIRRELQDIELLQETIMYFKPEQKHLFTDKLKSKIDKINDDIVHIIDKGQEVVDKRHEEYDLMSPGNLHFKYLQRHGYIWLFKQLEKALSDEDDNVEFDEEDIDQVKEVINDFDITSYRAKDMVNE